MEDLMPKKTKRAIKQKADKTDRLKRRRNALRDRVTLADRKQLITNTLEGIVKHTRPEDRAEIAEHIADIGIELLGTTYGVDSENALLMFPDDSLARLVDAIHAYEDKTQLPHDVVCDELIAKLDPSAARVFN